ncbi:MAG TPA: hypothetical protein VK753_09740, partial [Xanthomonadaceae bacterium]|nr:hypothetical protein [Xanthomonadaceae bacterium]
MNSIEIEVMLAVAGMIVFWNAAEWESRDGNPHHGVLWTALSLLLSVLVLFVLGWSAIPWLLVQAGLFIAIAAVRVLLEDR